MLPQIKTILYTTALGSHTRPVFRFAVGLARQHDARIVLLHVVEPLNNSVRFLMESYLSPETTRELTREATTASWRNSTSGWKRSAWKNSAPRSNRPRSSRKFA